MEDEFYNLVVKGNDLKTYIRRFQELAVLCPNMVPNTEKLMEVFINGLPRSIEGNVTASKPQTLEEAINIAQRLMDQIIKHDSVQEANDRKRKLEDKGNIINNNYQNNYNNNNRNNDHHQQQNRKQETFRTYTATNGLCDVAVYYHFAISTFPVKIVIRSSAFILEYLLQLPIRFKIDKKKRFRLTLEIFREILQICPRVQGQDFDLLPSEEDTVSFLRDLDHSGVINSLNDVVVDQMHQPWRTFTALINRSLSGKTTGLDKLRLSRSQIIWGMYFKKNVDYVALLWEDFTYQIDNKEFKKQEKMNYP
ncbi:hypothetical protein Tco_1069400 [Tanacetum coccineum]|uniref:Ty3 transposon capsid-like protein domain-containing protein n=1 Tax=Tanacetum coccineum TaxID=301880 RepID=A0ABQ5HKM5_9ASTR